MIITNKIYLFKNFNNYMNRKLKYYDSLDDYPTPEFSFDNTNFNPADGVNTQIIVNYIDADKCDYIVITDSTGNIISRWYIIEADRANGVQYSLKIRRDVVADKWDKIKIAPCYIEKATVSNGPLVVNPENITVNQIKKQQTLLKDKTGISWLVGYYARHEAGTSKETGERPLTELKGEASANVDYDYSFQTEDDYKASFGKYETQDFISNYNNNTYCEVYINYHQPIGEGLWYADKNYKGRYDKGNPGSVSQVSPGFHCDTKQPNFDGISSGYTTNWTTMEEKTRNLGNVHCNSESDTNIFLAYKNKIVKIGDKFYKIGISSNEGVEEIDNSNRTHNALTDEVANWMDTFVKPNLHIGASYNIIKPTYALFKHYNKLRITKTLLSNSQRGLFKYDIGTGRTITYDAPYDMFCIPFGDITIKGVSGIDPTKKLDCGIPGIISLYDMVSRFGVTSGGGAGILYDIQLLPYCPLSDAMLTDTNEVTVTDTAQYSLIKYTQKTTNDTETTVGIIFNCPKSSFDNVVINEPIEITNAKMQSQCDKYRLVSSDFNSQFEFDPVKNAGVKYFKVDFTYKPYSPYIHVYPEWDGLYGQDFGDPRGLVCNANYSLPIINNAWTQFELQNKNYQQMFNREIQHLDTVHHYDMLNGGLNVITRTIKGAFDKDGGGTLASALSLGRGIGDQFIQKDLYNEAVNFKRDMFNFQLGNIKAMPETLSRISAFTNNNFIFPILEYYTCTELEKQILARKIKYNGMTINALGTIGEYLGNSWSYGDITDDGYIKGQIIRLEDIEEETHFANEIANEIYKGVYTK